MCVTTSLLSVPSDNQQTYVRCNKTLVPWYSFRCPVFLYILYISVLAKFNAVTSLYYWFCRLVKSSVLCAFPLHVCMQITTTCLMALPNESIPVASFFPHLHMNSSSRKGFILVNQGYTAFEIEQQRPIFHYAGNSTHCQVSNWYATKVCSGKKL